MGEKEIRCWICRRNREEIIRDTPDDSWDPDKAMFKTTRVGGTRKIGRGLLFAKYPKMPVVICLVCFRIGRAFITNTSQFVDYEMK